MERLKIHNLGFETEHNGRKVTRRRLQVTLNFDLTGRGTISEQRLELFAKNLILTAETSAKVAELGNPPVEGRIEWVYGPGYVVEISQGEHD
ncbi:hypothetical protein [Actinomadura chibensis]|uniref:Uncharacterized protein n=1 Tax=Actinomadura chibensis TaxID=392828 RepID=A0A5D0NVR5_9ACTN|nr:hypothetical protein [Actinomadura chibensis]TYB48763.1 hypothetical protein FXF69_06220 [Actinomadura chibensis]